MVDEAMKTIDDHQTFYYMEMVSDCWLFLRLQFFTSIFIGVLSIATVMNRNTMGANLAGLSLTSAITVMQDVFLFARYAATLEKAMVSVERIKEYEDIIQVHTGCFTSFFEKSNGFNSETMHFKPYVGNLKVWQLWKFVNGTKNTFP